MSFDFQEQPEPAETEPIVAKLAAPATPPIQAEAVGETPVTEADSLSYLHPTSLIFDVISHGKSYLIPAVIAMFSAARGNTGGIILAAVIFIPAFLTSVFRYFTFRYRIQDKQLIVTKGLLFRTVRTVPVSRIQNIDFVQNILHRLLNVAEVRVETASGTEPEATLRVLSLEKMQQLRNEIFDIQSGETAAGQQLDGQSMDEATAPLIPAASREAGQSLLEIPTSWLVRAGLASNRGMIMIGILIGLFFQFDGEDRFEFLFNEVGKRIPKDADNLLVIAGGVVAVIGVLLLLRLLGIAWFVLRFHGYRLLRHGEDLRISCGLLTKVSATVPRNRIQFISIHRKLIMRWMGYCSVRIETAGGAGKEHEDATTTVSRRWFVPIIRNDQLGKLLNELRPGLDWDESQLDFQPLAPRASARLVRLAIVVSLVFAAVGLAITRPWGWAAGVVALPVLIWWAIKKSRSMRYARTRDGVVYRSGVLTRKTSMTFFEKIQTLSVEQSPFDRRWNMARLSVDTAASGPAEHHIEIPFLDQGFAREELQELRNRTARHQPSFG
jgi:putative membrane protein